MKKTPKKIFVCSRLRGDYEKNLEVAKSLCRIVAMMGNIPIAPHVYFTQFLKEDVENERKLGIELGMQLLSGCDEIWVFDFNGVSEGMEQEVNFALTHKIPIKYCGNIDFPLASQSVVSASGCFPTGPAFEYDDYNVKEDRRGFHDGYF